MMAEKWRELVEITARAIAGADWEMWEQEAADAIHAIWPHAMQAAADVAMNYRAWVNWTGDTFPDEPGTSILSLTPSVLDSTAPAPALTGEHVHERPSHTAPAGRAPGDQGS